MTEYDGRVEVGGPAQVRDLGPLRVTKVAVGPMSNNSYLLECTATGERLLIDAAAEPDTLLGVVGDRPLATIVTTHQHRDHWGALAQVAAATGATTVAHPLDAPGIGADIDRLVSGGESISVGEVQLRVHHFTGHTPGSISLEYVDPDGRAHVWTGDCLFPGGVGRTWAPEDFDTLYAGVVAALFDRLGDDTWVYPGHGADTTLGAERPQLAEWQERRW